MFSMCVCMHTLTHESDEYSKMAFGDFQNVDYST